MFALATIHIALLINTAFFSHNALDPSAAHRFPAIYVRAYYCFTASLFMVVVCGIAAVVLVRVRETCQNTSSSSSSLAGNVGPRCCIVPDFSFAITPIPKMRPRTHLHTPTHTHIHTHQTHTHICALRSTSILATRNHDKAMGF